MARHAGGDQHEGVLFQQAGAEGLLAVAGGAGDQPVGVGDVFGADGVDL